MNAKAIMAATIKAIGKPLNALGVFAVSSLTLIAENTTIINKENRTRETTIIILLLDDTHIERTYILPAGKEPVRDGIVNITTLSELREAIRSTVAAGKRTQTILFDSVYSGNPAEDLASACWQVRTEDALCAYCVENIAYELSQIVSYTEAQINISYSKGALPVNSIITMPYATDLNERIADAIKSGTSRLAILISRSALTEETMAAQFSDVYRQTPGLE